MTTISMKRTFINNADFNDIDNMMNSRDDNGDFEGGNDDNEDKGDDDEYE